jgi:hypothetical protein
MDGTSVSIHGKHSMNGDLNKGQSLHMVPASPIGGLGIEDCSIVRELVVQPINATQPK